MTESETQQFNERASDKNLCPLWEQVTIHQTFEPRPEAAAAWHWEDCQTLIEGAVGETSTSNAERRVLLMGNPAIGRMQATRTLSGGYQILMPGESARPHRHSGNALRFVLEDGGETYTVVDGKECLMQRGDIILTPANCWHGHVHRGSRRTVWFDSLDAQISAMFDVAFFEPGSALSGYPPSLPDESFVAVGLTPLAQPHLSSSHSPKFRYPWEESVAALAAAPLREDGSRLIRFTNPSGGAAMPPMDLFLNGVPRQPTRAHRSTANAVFVAAQGSGVSIVGNNEIRWRENDVFTAPRWQWTEHRAESDDAILFQVTDRGALTALGLLKDEYR
jgi:gentisate 1,2-dioxygenase